MDRGQAFWGMAKAQGAQSQQVDGPARLKRLAAVDAVAVAYYKNYYGPYGEALVRDIKLRVNAGLAAAARNAGRANVRVAHQPVAVSDDHRTVEGVALFLTEVGLEKRAFVASLNVDGTVARIETEVVR